MLSIEKKTKNSYLVLQCQKNKIRSLKSVFRFSSVKKINRIFKIIYSLLRNETKLMINN